MRIGLDVGGTNIKAAVLSEDCLTVGKFETPTRADLGYGAVLCGIKTCAETAAAGAGCGMDEFKTVGIAVPGLIDAENGLVVSAPNLGWTEKNLNADIAPVLGIKARIENDARCAALAESRVGAGKGLDNIIMLTLGTAVGAAAILHGKLFDGFGRFGGELGHIPLVHGGLPCSCGNRGCFEQYGSATALMRIAKGKTGKYPDSLLNKPDEGEAAGAVNIFRAAERDDGAALEALEEYTTYLAEGVAGLVNIFRPDAVILGGGLADIGGDALTENVERKVFARVCASELIGAPQIKKAALGLYAGAAGAALLAYD